MFPNPEQDRTWPDGSRAATHGTELEGTQHSEQWVSLRTKLFPRGQLTITGNILTATAIEVWVLLEVRDTAILSAMHSTATTNRII